MEDLERARQSRHTAVVIHLAILAGAIACITSWTAPEIQQERDLDRLWSRWAGGHCFLYERRGDECIFFDTINAFTRASYFDYIKEEKVGMAARFSRRTL